MSFGKNTPTYCVSSISNPIAMNDDALVLWRDISPSASRFASSAASSFFARASEIAERVH